MLDLRLDKDGDLVLGQQAVDNEGYLLYYHYINDNSDIGITNNPEIGVVPVRDIGMIYSAEGDAQLIQTRLRTENPDWVLYPNLGSTLTDLLGEMNNEETASRGIEMIYNALTYDGAFTRQELEVDAIPISYSTILFHVKLIRNNTIVTYAMTLDFEIQEWNEYDMTIDYQETGGE